MTEILFIGIGYSTKPECHHNGLFIIDYFAYKIIDSIEILFHWNVHCDIYIYIGPIYIDPSTQETFENAYWINELMD